MLKLIGSQCKNHKDMQEQAIKHGTSFGKLLLCKKCNCYYWKAINYRKIYVKADR
jgi:uncharacterized protein with PIN domain